MRMNCFDRRTLMELSLTLSSGFSKSSAINCPARRTGAIVDYATAGKLCVVHPCILRLVRRVRAASIRYEKFMKIY